MGAQDFTFPDRAAGLLTPYARVQPGLAIAVNALNFVFLFGGDPVLA